MASKSRWLVGSSRMRQSHSPARSCASATRFCCPPDNSRVSASAMAPIPSLSNIASACHVPPIASRTVPLGRCGICGRTPMRALRPRRTTPASGSDSPDKMRNSVLLPHPFKPTTPRRSPVLTVTETLVKSARPGREAVRPSASMRIMSVAPARNDGGQCKRWLVRFKSLKAIATLEQRDQCIIATSKNSNATNFAQTGR